MKQKRPELLGQLSKIIDPQAWNDSAWLPTAHVLNAMHAARQAANAKAETILNTLGIYDGIDDNCQATYVGYKTLAEVPCCPLGAPCSAHAAPPMGPIG